MKPKFSAGKNIAMKVPPREYEETVVFYRDILELEMIEPSTNEGIESVVFRFGNKNLWIDKVSTLNQAEIWLEIVTDDLAAASRFFADRGCLRRDDVEPLPVGFKGFWLANPANIIHLIKEEKT